MYKIIDGYPEMVKEIGKQKYPCQFTLTGYDIENIVVAALEGGVGYWAILDNTTSDWTNKPRGLPVSQYATQLLLEEKPMRFIDVGNEMGRLELTLRKFLNGMEQYMQYGASKDINDVDAVAADMIFQYALFGEVVYA